MRLQITEPSYKSISRSKKKILTTQKAGSFLIIFLLASEDESAQSNLRFKKKTQIFKANDCTFFSKQSVCPSAPETYQQKKPSCCSAVMINQCAKNLQAAIKNCD